MPSIKNKPELPAEVREAVERLNEWVVFDGPRALSPYAYKSVTPKADLRTVLAALAEAQRDRERLLDALQQIATTKPLCGLNPKAKVSDPQDMKLVWNVHAIARAAIEEARR